MKTLSQTALAICLLTFPAYSEQKIMQCEGAVFKWKNSFWTSPAAYKRVDGKWQNLKSICNLSLEYSDMGVTCKQSGSYEKTSGGVVQSKEIIVDEKYSQLARENIARQWKLCRELEKKRKTDKENPVVSKGLFLMPELSDLDEHLEDYEKFLPCVDRSYIWGETKKAYGKANYSFDVSDPNTFLPKALRKNDYQLTQSQFLKKFTPKVGTKFFYSFTSPETIEKTIGEENHVLDFLLLSWKVNKKHGSEIDNSLVKSQTLTKRCEILKN